MVVRDVLIAHYVVDGTLTATFSFLSCNARTSVNMCLQTSHTKVSVSFVPSSINVCFQTSHTKVSVSFAQRANFGVVGEAETPEE